MKFAATFQQRYKDDFHPKVPGVDHRSYLIIEAENEMQARVVLTEAVGETKNGGNYAFLYDLDGDFIVRQVVMYALWQLPFTIRKGADGTFKWWLRMPSGIISIGTISEVTKQELKDAARNLVDDETR